MSNKLRPPLDVLYVIGGLELGGTERHLSLIAKALQVSGLRIGVYSLAGDGPLRDDLARAGVEIFLPPFGRDAVGNSLAMRALRMMLAGCHLTVVMVRTSPRITHFFLPAAYIVGGVAAFVARIKIRVMSRRSLNIYQRGVPGARLIERLLHLGMSAILGNSRAVVRELAEEGVPRRKLGLIYNGIELSPDESGSRADIRSGIGLDDSSLIYVIVANLIPYKGHLDLVAALEIAHQQIETPWHLLIVGRDDGAGPSIIQAVKKAGLEERISLLGSRRDVARLLSASDIGLLCSHQEGFSNAILEGMAAGLPMIVTDVGGNAEAVLNGETGYVVPAQNPTALAAAISSLARDPIKRTRFGEAGRDRIEKEFSLNACVSKYDVLYRELQHGKLPAGIPELKMIED